MKLASLSGKPEIFYTIQAEGVSQGAPAVFIRASLCNLHCIWCDTEYTWNFKNTPWKHQKDAQPDYKKHDQQEVILEISPQQVAQQVISFQCKRLVLTGGEPLLQQADFISCLEIIERELGLLAVEVETNGTVIPSQAFEQRVLQFNVSPKLSHSGMPQSTRIKPEALRYFAASPKSWFKFVVSSEQDVKEVQELQSAYAIPHDRIILMPEGRTVEQLNQSSIHVVEWCKAYGYRFSDRLHIRLWGEKRGV